MATKKIVNEIIDGIVVAFFLLIFGGIVSAYLIMIIKSPAASTIANFGLTLANAYDDEDARYPLIIKESNNYNLLGNDFYITQLRSSENLGDNSSERVLKNNCGEVDRNCICLINVLNCDGVSCADVGGELKTSCSDDEYEDKNVVSYAAEENNKCCVEIQSKAELIFETENIKELLTPPTKLEDDMKLITLEDEQTLSEFTTKLLEKTTKQATCEAGDAVFFQVINCLQITDKTDDLLLVFNEKPVILFPTSSFKEYAESRIVELKFEKVNDTTIKIDRIIELK